MKSTHLAVTVIAKQLNGAGNVLLTLGSASDQPLPHFTPGAHIDVHLPIGGTRQYSLCSPAHAAHYEICVRLEPATKGGSEWLHHQLHIGDELSISAPRNHFPLPHAPRTLLFAAGIGLTPLLVMAEALAVQEADFVLHLYIQRQDELAFAPRLALLGDRAVIHYSAEGDSLRTHHPAELGSPENGALVACGPVWRWNMAGAVSRCTVNVSNRNQPHALQATALTLRSPRPGLVSPSARRKASLRYWKTRALKLNSLVNKACAEPVLPACCRAYRITVMRC